MTFTQFKNLYEIYDEEEWFIRGKTASRKHYVLYQGRSYSLENLAISRENSAILLFGSDRLIVHIKANAIN